MFFNGINGKCQLKARCQPMGVQMRKESSIKNRVAFLMMPFLLVQFATGQIIQNDVFWEDTDGNPMYVQRGGTNKIGDTWYMYGAIYDSATSYYNEWTGSNAITPSGSVSCYTSKDLVNWKNEGPVFTFWGGWFCGPNVAYNKNTKKYVLIAQANNDVLFATADSPTGPFTQHHIETPSPMANGGTGDATTFIDDDGTPYIICSNMKGRSHIYVIPLRASDYLACERTVEIFSGHGGREGNCMFKYKGRYYACSGDLHGWNTSHCYYISSTNILGPYNEEKIMVNSDLDFCHVTQSGFFITVNGTEDTTVIYCGDRWSNNAGNGIGYNQWCPITIDGTTATFNSYSQWSIDAVKGTWEVGPGNNYILNPSFEADRVLQSHLAGWTGAKNVKDSHSAGNFCLYQTESGTASQNIDNIPNGTYELKAWVKSSGGQSTCKVFISDFGGSEMNYDISQNISNWEEISIPNINITTGKCTVGVTSVNSGSNWCKIDELSLIFSADIPAVYGDFNEDRWVDMDDLCYFVESLWLGDFWSDGTCTLSAELDLNDDCGINTVEYAAMVGNWTGPDTVAPSAPGGLSAIVGNGTVSLDWFNNSEQDLDSYCVYRSTTSGSGYTQLASDLTDSAYVDNTVTNDITYYYVVTAVDTKGNESDYSVESSARPVTPILVAHYELENNSNDSSPNGNHAVATGAPVYTTGYLGQAVDLDGSDDYLTLPGDVANSNDITVAAWVHWDGGGSWQRIFDFGNNTTEYMFLTPSSGDGTLRFAITTSGNGAEQVVETSELATGQWVHVAVTLEGNTGTLYVNGLSAASNFVTLDPPDFAPVNNYIGQSQWPDPLFDGRIDDFRIYNYALSASDIRDLGTDGDIYEAESALYGGEALLENNHAGFMGTGFINFPTSGGYLEFTGIDGGDGGDASLDIRYALGAAGTRTGNLVVNGVSQSITFDPTGDWTTWTVKNLTVPLNSGTSNTIRFESNGQDLANIDEIIVAAP